MIDWAKEAEIVSKIPDCLFEVDSRLWSKVRQFYYNYDFFCVEKPKMIEKLKDAVKNGDTKFISNFTPFIQYCNYKNIDIYTIDDVKNYIEEYENKYEELKENYERRNNELQLEIKQALITYNINKINEDFV